MVTGKHSTDTPQAKYPLRSVQQNEAKKDVLTSFPLGSHLGLDSALYQTFPKRSR